MVYMAAGISGLTGIVGTFFVKEYLGLPASFLAALGFWAGIPWALKMPLGHLVDLIWRWKSGLIYLGAGLIAASLLIMVGLLERARGHGRDHAGRSLVCALDAAGAGRLRDPGRGRRRDDRRGGAARGRRRARPSTPRPASS